jgi:hypothetical protein
VTSPSREWTEVCDLDATTATAGHAMLVREFMQDGHRRAARGSELVVALLAAVSCLRFVFFDVA